MPKALIAAQPIDGAMNRLVNGNVSRGLGGWSSEPRTGAVVPAGADAGISHFSDKTGGGFPPSTLHKPVYTVRVPKGHDLLNTFEADDLVFPTYRKELPAVIFRPSTYDTYFTDTSPSSPLVLNGIAVEGTSVPVFVVAGGTELQIRMDRVNVPDLSAPPLPAVWLTGGTAAAGPVATLGSLDPLIETIALFYLTGATYPSGRVFDAVRIPSGEVLVKVKIAGANPGSVAALAAISTLTPAVAWMRRSVRVKEGEIVTGVEYNGFFSERYRMLQPIPSSAASKMRARPEKGGVRFYADSGTFGDATIVRLTATKHEITFPFVASDLGRDGVRPLMFGNTSPIESGDAVLTPLYGARVTTVVETATTTVVTVDDADGYGKRGFGSLSLPSGSGVLTGWRMCQYVIIAGHWETDLPNYALTIAYHDIDGARTRSYVRFLDDYGRIVAQTGYVEGTLEEVAPSGLERRVQHLHFVYGDVPLASKAQLVIFDDGTGPDNHRVGDVQLIRGLYGLGVPIGDDTVVPARDVPVASTAGESSIVQPGTLMLFAGGNVCPPGWRNVITGPSTLFDPLGGTEGRGAMILGTHTVGSPVVAAVVKEQSDASDQNTLRTNLVVNVDLTAGSSKQTFASDRTHSYSSPIGVRYPIPTLRAGMLLVAMPKRLTKRGKVTKAPMVWVLADVFGAEIAGATITVYVFGVPIVIPVGPGPTRRLVMSLVGDHEVAVRGAMAEEREFFIVESSYLRHEPNTQSPRILGDNDHVHSVNQVGGITVECNQFGPGAGVIIRIPSNHGHHRLGEPAAPVPFGRLFMLCQKL